MKLHEKRNKKIAIALIAVGVVLIIGIIVACVMNISKPDNIKITSISINARPDSHYYVGEEFNPEGTRIQVLTNKPNFTYWVDYRDLTFSGFDSSAPTESQTITVTYQGHQATFNIVIEEYPVEAPTLVSIDVPNVITTYTLEAWNKYGPRLGNLKIVLTYSDGSTREIPLESSIHVMKPERLSSPGTTELTVIYTESGVTFEHKIVITVT